ncbi:MAG: hypothetical protein AB1632_08260 [Nitrospirota bacterium]
MKLKIISIVTLISFISLMPGCATMEEHRGATTGAAIGGATGAVAGAVLADKGAKTETAIIGGLIGALIGGAIGHYAYDVKRSRQETEQRYNYQPSSGTMVRLEDVSVSPSSVYAGNKVEIASTYAVLTSSQYDEVRITEIREIRHGDDLVGKPEVSVIRKGGTYTSTVPVFLPKDAKKGTYRVLATIQTPTTKDSRETTFTVK